MAETRPTASATSSVKATSVQPKKSGNAISWLAPIICVVAGYCIWRFILGAENGFEQPDKSGGFWPHHQKPKDGLHGIYEGGIIVPLLIGMLLMVITFSIERLMTITKAL
ncbi:MAG TPA: MotA/TolQ/ExbB proton channel family protein, partial [Flavisolibacter sp.]|nr:MotA/TolQ/ExbB proton channel family protein [Flavisolibacter sp.]